MSDNMKKIIILLCLLAVSFMLASCGFETTQQHESRMNEEAESIKEMQETSTSGSSGEENTELSEAGSETTAPTETSTAKNSSPAKAPTTSSPTQPTTTSATQETTTAPKVTETTQPVPVTINVTIAVRCDNVVGNPDLKTSASIPSSGIMLRETQITVKEGASVHDVIDFASKLGYLTYTDGALGGMGGYVSSINGLYEKSCGTESGWKFQVNEVPVGVGSKIKKVKAGDRIVWFYAITADEELN